jgi:protein TonB
MMMALRNSPSEYALIHALDGPPAQRPPSKALAVAISVSVAFHLGLLAYLYLERMGAEPPAALPDQATTMTLVSLPPPAPAHPVEQPRQQAIAVHSPVLTPLSPPPTVTTLRPLPVVASNGPGALANLAPFTPPATSRLITDPKWLSQPTAAEMSRFYPQRDIDLGVAGQVSLLCGVVASGKLADCRVVGETPPNAGFGDAALKLSAFFRMTPRTIDGEPVDGGQTRISIAFRLSDAG